MAEGKKIEIRIAATGGDQAAAEFSKPITAIRKAEASIKVLQASIDELSTKDFSEENQKQIEALTAKLEQAKEGYRELAAEAEKAAESTSGLDENVGKIARVQKAQAIAELAGQIGQLGTKLKEVSGDVEEFDAGLAESLRNAGENIEKVSSAAQNMAIGFAVGGPLGAGIAGIGSLTGELAQI